MAVGFGIATNQFFSPKSYYTKAQWDSGAAADGLLNVIDGIRTIWAQSLGLTGGNAGAPSDPFDVPEPGSPLALNAHLYPAVVHMQCVLSDPRDVTQDSAPWGGNFPHTRLMDGLRLRGITALISLSLDHHYAVNHPDDPNPPKPWKWAKWPTGVWDDWLLQFAADAKAWATNDNSTGKNWRGLNKSSMVIVRVGWEQNGYWFPWGMTRTANSPVQESAGTVADFKTGFKYIHDKIQKGPNGARNVKFLYCPNLHGLNQGNPTSQYLPQNGLRVTGALAQQYPGDDACEFVGFDAYSMSRKANEYIGTGTNTPGVLLNAWEPTIRSGWYSGYWELADPNAPTGPAGSKPLIIGEFGVNGAALDVVVSPPGVTPIQTVHLVGATDLQQAAFFTGSEADYDSKAPNKDLAGGLIWVQNNFPLIRILAYFDISNWQLSNTALGMFANDIDVISPGNVFTDPTNKNIGFIGSLPALTGSEVTEIAVLDADVDITDGTGMVMDGSLAFSFFVTPAPEPEDNAGFYLYEGDDMDTLEPVWD